MLSQVERGEANPTFATLWSLTQALDISIEDLVHVEDVQKASRVDVLPRSATPRLGDDGTGVTLWLLAPPEHVGVVEWYELELEPDGHLSSRAHASGTTEHLTVLSGAVTVQSGESTVDVTTGGTARYIADTDHVIANPYNEPARALLVVLGSEIS